MKNNMLNDQELENVVGGITQNDAMAAVLKHAGIPDGAAMMKKCELDYEWASLIMSGASRYTKLNSIITGWSTSTRSIPQPVPF